MSRLFITPREISFYQDIIAEQIRDSIGQKVYYFSISANKTKVDTLYNESPDKIFENPVEIACLVKYLPEDVVTTVFGSEEIQKIEVYIQKKQLINNHLEVSEGDFFSFGVNFFEIVSAVTENIFFGQTEYDVGIKLMGIKARKNQFLAKVFGPKDEQYTDPDAKQEFFQQTRGFKFNDENVTGDERNLIKNGVLELPEKPAQVSHKGSNADNGGLSSFYDE